MPDHFAAFAAAAAPSGEAWTGLVDRGYQALSALESSSSPGKGLLPDIFLGPVDNPQPAPDSLDSTGAPYHNNAYYYIASRVPWRVGTHAALAGAQRARDLLAPLSSWFATTTAGDPSKVGAGYALDGSSLGTAYAYETMAFVAPLGVAAMSDAGSSASLDALWSAIEAFPQEAYYEDSVKLLSMLVMSGNWWAPDARERACP